MLAALPTRCEVCRLWSRGRICAACLARHSPSRARCERCAIPCPAALCGDCLRDAPPFRRAIAAVDYTFPWDRLIRAFKFDGRDELATVLAALLADALKARDEPAPHWVLPMPLAPRRLAERGYNQAWSIARAVARRLRLPARWDLLQRPVEGAQQAGLGRAERQRNLRAAFLVPPALKHELAGRRVALVDDVLTTGATAREAASELLRAGAESVEVWVVARTP